MVITLPQIRHVSHPHDVNPENQLDPCSCVAGRQQRKYQKGNTTRYRELGRRLERIHPTQLQDKRKGRTGVIMLFWQKFPGNILGATVFRDLRPLKGASLDQSILTALFTTKKAVSLLTSSKKEFNDTVGPHNGLLTCTSA